MANRAEHPIVVETLTKRYGNLLAVNGVSFTVRKGEIFGLLGPNGAGKTTTVEMIERLRKPTAGKSTFGDRRHQKQPEIIRRIGVQLQGRACTTR